MAGIKLVSFQDLLNGCVQNCKLSPELGQILDKIYEILYANEQLLIIKPWSQQLSETLRLQRYFFNCLLLLSDGRVIDLRFSICCCFKEGRFKWNDYELISDDVNRAAFAKEYLALFDCISGELSQQSLPALVNCGISQIEDESDEVDKLRLDFTKLRTIVAENKKL